MGFQEFADKVKMAVSIQMKIEAGTATKQNEDVFLVLMRDIKQYKTK